jgi:hypothetical protein
MVSETPSAGFLTQYLVTVRGEGQKDDRNQPTPHFNLDKPRKSAVSRVQSPTKIVPEEGSGKLRLEEDLKTW